MMTFLTAFLAILGLGLLDSLNPFSIAACAVVIAGQQSLGRGLAFIIATFLVYFLTGVALVTGWVELVIALKPLIKPWMKLAFWLVLALICLIGAIILWRRPPMGDSKAVKQPSSVAIIGVFLFALGSTLSDMPTALPYFGAIPIMVATDANMLGLLAWLAFYSLLYVSPLMVLLAYRLIAHKQFEPLIGKINRLMDWTIRRLSPALLVPCGVWASYEAYRVYLAL
jgi:cytochrome c biogenesis protein CcdA